MSGSSAATEIGRRAEPNSPFARPLYPSPPSILETVERRFGAIEELAQTGRHWRIVRAGDSIVTWPNLDPGEAIDPFDEVLGQILGVRRTLTELDLAVLVPEWWATRRPDLLIGLLDLCQAFAMTVPTVAFYQLQAGTLTPPLIGSGLQPVEVGELDPVLAKMIGQVFVTPTIPDVAWYLGSVFAEYEGIPVLGTAAGQIMVGVDPRDQAMAQETDMTNEAIIDFAREVVAILAASRRQRSGRFDFSRIAVGRLLRALYRREQPTLVSFEVGPVGVGRSRAYATAEGVLMGFGRALDLWLIIETAVLYATRHEESRVVYVLDEKPMRIFHELARLVGVPYSIEVKELTGG